MPGDALGEATLARARAGDDQAFRELTDRHRRELQLHCYRILCSMQDAEDMVQETLLAAWRSLEAFEGRASVRSWLYRIATNRCLNALRARSRRPRQVPAMDDALEPTRRIEPVWLDPYPDVLLEDIPDRSAGPAARYEARESIELSFIVALQHLPPRQRAALVLADVLGFRTAEVAEMLDSGETSVKGALQRARAALRAQLPAADRDRAPRPSSAGERQLVGRFADAVQSGDVDEIVSLLTHDARVTMPPLPLEYQGHDAIAAFMRQRASLRDAPLRVVPTRANTQPAFGCYLPDAHAAIARPYSLFVLTLEGDAIAAITWFFDTGVFRHFGLPSTLPRL
ncbi:MAG TPA: sigma-70 family RNA polymerase sigma factor [Solirubrobacteraceae bacterium]|nr:sigma-70 family RNA polymerase sigma factor [Solirubrobacteraceae bacterium]